MGTKKSLSMIAALPLFMCGCKTAINNQPIKIQEPTKEEIVSVQIGQGIFAKSDEVVIYMNGQKIVVNKNGVLILNNVNNELEELPVQPPIIPEQPETK